MNDRRPPDSTLIAPDARERLKALRSLELPLIVLVGGATGTGKSTVATEVAHRLGITRVTSTDVVRQTMRAFFSREFMPAIHPSSFEAGEAVRAHQADESEADLNLRGFLEQTRNVLVGVRAVVARAIEEGYSLVLEGVHLVPGALPSSIDGAVLCQYLLAIEDEEEHASHFWTRDSASEGARPFDKYLRALPDIRRIQEYLVERAGKNRIPVVENSDVDATVDQVIRHVLAAVERTLPSA
jgi:2-phosphoglycerate kinase